MPRPQSPDGPWVTVPVRLRQPDLDRVDAARGPVTRSEWGRGAMLAALDGVPVRRQEERPDPAPEPRKRKARAKADVVPPSTGPLPDPPAPAPAPPKPQRCPHPGTRNVGGFCKECDHLVGVGGYWK